MDKNKLEKDKILFFERREKDRRKKPTPPLSKHTFIGRRKKNRRSEDIRKNYYVDRYGRRTLAFACLIIALCITDTLVTLYLISHGAEEINPFMAMALSYGTTVFLVVKYILNGLCVIVLSMHKNFYIFNGRINIKFIAIMVIIAYLGLILYEISLLRTVVFKKTGSVNM